MSQRSDCVVRPAGSRDVHAIAEIYNHYVHVGGSTFDNSPWSPVQAQSLLDGDPGAHWCVATIDDALVGWASAKRFSARFGYRFSLESAVYVHPKSISRGIGTQLMHSLHQACCDAEVHHLMARIIADNQSSIAFHQSLGFEIIGVQKEVGRMNDEWIDVVLLQKLL
ncbi:GNAT family N-acetyltransferase [Rubripirellula amarantea]|nr:GNAT family N-acetyltransferase [Rubripirellula amarantea]